ncbi:protein of unknown function DUF72 [Candidatus Koribacter versatilis Ellin345]|uniref:DUF72 domain-containing protein n=1 Tax=Koribacter versatilis (strain Ellin345) TaxID=204669 RepID=Q1IMN7_KORVE|nr:DUF72 domain-containing protein [Candidatus Koribacter versatilis]ABF41863.1 protein of unknown function DUF72 [Candidatus Koribacter versatilis Ellin345]
MSPKKEWTFDAPPQPNGYYVGTSGWTYDIWQPTFFPESLPKAKFLPYYASRLTACEVNFTFRNRLSEKTALKWIAETPESFLFVCKAHQFITHIRRLKQCEEPVRNLATGMEPLFNAGRFGAVLFQLPPNLKADVAMLREFLASLPKWMKSAFEFRHETWLTDEIYKALADHNAALCIAETEDLATPEVLTTSFAYYRFRMPEYSPDAIKKLAERVKASRAKVETVFAFFKHDERPQSPLDAMDLLQRVLK